MCILETGIIPGSHPRKDKQAEVTLNIPALNILVICWCAENCLKIW